jgi:cytochrome c oxidase subunit IV
MATTAHPAADASHASHGPTIALYISVWLGLILIVAVETVLTYAHLSPGRLLASLLVLALIEAGIALRYFMHLKWEPPALAWTLIPAVVFALLMMNQIWADAYRLATMRFPAQ